MTALRKLSPKARHNVTILLEALRYQEIKRLCASFHGSGDDGDVWITDIKSIDDDVVIKAEALREIPVIGAHMSEMWEDGKKRDWDKKPPTIHDLIYETCWAELEANYGGWEIDHGSSGEFIFEPLATLEKRDPVTIHFSYNEPEYDYDDEEYNDE